MFANRAEAGIALARVLKERSIKRPLVLALPRGGVPVGLEVARSLKCPLDTIVSRKVAAPFNPEFAVGAIAPGDIFVLDEDSLRSSGVSRVSVEGVVENEKKEMLRRADVYRSGAYSAGYIPGTVVIVDDGIATGLSARAACLSVRKKYPKAKILFATPVCLGSAQKELKECADEIICLETSPSLYAVGQAYEEFNQVSDVEVTGYLKSAAA
jgi:putative phosphoribosyl transferase